MCLRYSSRVVAPIVCSSPAGEHRLEQVRGVHRAFGRARADDRVELVDEQDHLALGVLDLLEDGLEPFLELATELGAGDECPEVERDDPLLLERLGHVAADDPLGESLGDGRLADARLADEDRVVLGPAGQDLDDATDLVVAADDRVELAGTGFRGQVTTVLLEGGVRAFGVRRRHALAAADALQGTEDGFLAGAVALQQALGLAADLGRPDEQVFGRDVVVTEATGLLLGSLDDPLRARVEAQRATGDPGTSGEGSREFAAERRAGPPRGVAASRPGSRRPARRGRRAGVRHPARDCRAVGRWPARPRRLPGLSG